MSEPRCSWQPHGEVWVWDWHLKVASRWVTPWNFLPDEIASPGEARSFVDEVGAFPGGAALMWVRSHQKTHQEGGILP